MHILWRPRIRSLPFAHDPEFFFNRALNAVISDIYLSKQKTWRI